MTLVSTTLVFVLSACGPIGQMPGVRLGGTEVASPSSWNEVSDVHLRVRDDVFVLRATRIADLATKTRVGEAYLQKYRGVIAGGGVEWGPDFLKDYILLRLDPR